MPLLPRTNPLFRTQARRVGFYTGTLLTAGAVFDYNNYNVLSRSIRTLLGGAYIVYLYKLTTPKNLYELNELHAEAARTVRDICLANEGLYIKLGQLISSMNSAVPPVVIDILKVLLDDAPKVDIAIVKNILSRELAGVERNQSEWLSKHTQRLADRDRLMARTKTLANDRSAKIPEAVLYENLKAYREGHHDDTCKNNSSTKDNAADAASASDGGVVGEVKNNSSSPSIDPALAPYFLAFDEVPVASASIAQVHKAVIRDPTTGEPVTVAVKILKPAIRTQIWYDCTCHSILTHAIEKLFQIPITHNNETIDRNLTRESDFYVEAAHTDLLRECLKDKKDVYIPRVFYEYLTDQIMVTEWVDAVKLSESSRIKNEILGKGIVSSKGLMTSLINAFNDMVFVHGAVNCDPHPANLMVRPHPRHIDTIRETKKRWEEEDRKYVEALEEYEVAKSRGEAINGLLPPPTASFRQALPSPDLRAPRHQLILIDHGLCVTIPDTFRYEYGLFFRSLLGRDVSELSRLVTRWGVADTDLFVTMTLQKPFSSKKTADSSSSNASEGSDGKPAGFFDEMSKRGGRKYTVEELAAMQQMMKERLSKFLSDEELMPKEMLFIGRSFNYLRAINKEFGAPVNRLKMSADCAFRMLEKVRIESLDDLEMWERCGRKQDAYLAARKELKKDTFTSDLSMLKRRIIIQMALLWLDLFQIFVTFYNTVVVPVIALPLTVTLGAAASASPSAKETYHEAIYKKLRIGTMEDILEARESQMSEQMWGTGGAPVAEGEVGGVKMNFVPDIGVND